MKQQKPTTTVVMYNHNSDFNNDKTAFFSYVVYKKFVENSLIMIFKERKFAQNMKRQWGQQWLSDSSFFFFPSF